MNKNMKLSEHFTLGELAKDTPSQEAIENLKNLCENWLEDLRYSYNTLYSGDCPQQEAPLVINSGYRSPEVNKRVGGSPFLTVGRQSAVLSFYLWQEPGC